ncbi:copper chaperone PCu(A)C [Pseudonocardia oroxyli]|uniref:Copper(I)-binding protein n=1 Tax=Pseudonocardia oroxyli TaxID=366584 RepID=A0A1G7PCD5_PSEOR|nr:copper chaperone PCu(A)C [Pseudonocardia oroxyli]SDF83943.1 Copper(I)-binding protein [Pseudonocardia oroxyli]
MSRASLVDRATTQRTPARLVRVLAAVAVAGVALAGCGAGMQAQTSQQVAAVAGASANGGGIAVRNAEIAYPGGLSPEAAIYPVGGVAPVEMVIVNQGAQTDRLVSATSPAGTVTITGEQTVAPDISLVAGQVAGVPGGKQVTIEITGLREDILSGRTYPLVLTFEKAGRVEVGLPVASPTVARVDQAPEGGGGH